MPAQDMQTGCRLQQQLLSAQLIRHSSSSRTDSSRARSSLIGKLRLCFEGDASQARDCGWGAVGNAVSTVDAPRQQHQQIREAAGP
jgi:hypothetical protein